MGLPASGLLRTATPRSHRQDNGGKGYDSSIHFYSTTMVPRIRLCRPARARASNEYSPIFNKSNLHSPLPCEDAARCSQSNAKALIVVFMV